ncbi:MAG: hypothetical protein GOVbin4933_47 [Prokaryotic dsDNA virus sp.]|nr:MAG: hypothetical protein GOVbin4933_47 [Prokaryotic dsDNA virus sp.]
MPSVFQDWVHDLPFMQQSVLMSAMRNADMVEKGHPSKDLVRWYRRCVVLSAFEGAALTDTAHPGGGSYTGPVEDIEKAADDFLRARDGMSLHYYAHAMHAFQIVGVHHPDPGIGLFWADVYVRMAKALHLYPEPRDEMNLRLSDDPEAWKAREDRAGGCST